MFKSKLSTIISLIIIVAIIVVFVVQHAPWWIFIGLFFAYMSVFSNLMALLLGPRNPYAERTLTKCAYIFGSLFMVSLIGLVIVGFCLK